MYKMSDLKDKLKIKYLEKFWTNEYRMFCACDDFSKYKENNNLMGAYTINQQKFEDKSREFCNQCYISGNTYDEDEIREFFDDECIVAIEPDDVLTFSFPHNKNTFIEFTSCYLYSNNQVDFTANFIMNNNKKLHRLIQTINGIQDRKNNYVVVIYKIKFVVSDKNLMEGGISHYLNFTPEKLRYISDIPQEKLPAKNVDFDDSTIIPLVKTKKVKRTNYKKKKRRSITEEEIEEPLSPEPEEPLSPEPEEILSYIPKSREEYFRKAYIQASISKVVINRDNIYNGSIFTKRVYLLWDNIQISFNMKWYFSSSDMNEIIILLDDLYLKEPRFRIQVNYYRNILITHPIHYDDIGGLIGNHFTGFFADSENIEKTKTLHFYIVKNQITSITFKEHSQIEEL